MRCITIATAFLLLAPSSCGGPSAAFPGGEGGPESVAMRLVTTACEDPSAARALFLSYDEFGTFAPRAGVTNPGTRITSTSPSKDDYDGDCQYVVAQLCDQSQMSGKGAIVGSAVVPAEHPDADSKLGLDTAHVKFVVEKDGVRGTPGHAFLFLRTSRGWKLAWIED